MSSPLSHTALLLIDIQQGFDHPTHWGTKRSNPSFEANIISLLRAFRQSSQIHPTSGPSIIHIYHKSANVLSPLHPSSPGFEFQPYASPLDDEFVRTKSVNSAFIGTCLDDLLRDRDIWRLFVVGLTTDHCISTSVRMAANLRVTEHVDEETGKAAPGQVILIADATATWEKGEFDAETVHKVHVASLKDEFCEVVTTSHVLEEILPTLAGTPSIF